MRSLPAGLDPSVVEQIDRRLEGLTVEHGVTIPWAIESGSRAWGFPSPDSDYDCRFFFVRPRQAYLSPWRPRDVIETPLDAVLDVNGWDLIKAVDLAVRGNATVSEWLRSPMVYGGDEEFRDALLALCEAVGDRDRITRHYLHVGGDHWTRSGAASGDQVALKRVFYAIRPAAALHWLATHADRCSPPMNLQELFEQAPPPPSVQEAVHRLVEAKAVTRELGHGVVEPSVVAWVEEQLGRAADRIGAERQPTTRARTDAELAFVGMLDRWGPR
ncbi:nucleotidyltransferase domain-containing protein [Luteipulveratus flavus]|uniref:Nucleotidyltransferase domain-containing protein n=1 Tax=Luteipulveratus flavus TaxID=3031728 RepID=A0ABT6C7K4_9MICO|nr:nucleotidyltransferase domain-containing protein [Luteipulveratus sp. YIM 133296]MDF8263261.1 nucleotidyltransferase domain-containing protein [Luteipulveratus sp. YIM 133296]